MDYIIIKIGCLECERDSELVGKYHSKEKADKECARLQTEMESEKHYLPKEYSFQVFPVPYNYS